MIGLPATLTPSLSDPRKRARLSWPSFAGKTKIKLLYSDGCPSIKAAVEELGIVGDKSNASCPQSNAIVENMVRIPYCGNAGHVRGSWDALLFLAVRVGPLLSLPQHPAKE